jgi:outer membrane lipoprotein-sorting protein
MQKIAPIVVLMCIAMLVLSSCGEVSDPAVKAVEDYLNALVNKNANALSALSCAKWESNALLELDSLQAVATKLENLSCRVTGSNGSTTQVICQGKIMATYNGEDQQFDLSVRTYQVVNQGGEYLVCGYQ